MAVRVTVRMGNLSLSGLRSDASSGDARLAAIFSFLIWRQFATVNVTVVSGTIPDRKMSVWRNRQTQHTQNVSPVRA